jgi:NAD(P)-dependent dehydrogenase (short-subunit alcohol dehydrogenase family)
LSPTTAGRLNGEVAIVTGATSGLGIEIARLFVAEGARVVITGRNAERGAKAAVRTGAEFVRADLSNDDDLAALVDHTATRYGMISVLVNNANSADATSTDGPVAEVTRQAWEQMLQVDVVGAALLCSLVIPHMLREGRGSIVQVSSRVAALGTPGLTAYGSAKAAQEALARAITIDYGRQGIRCNTVRPGYIIHEDRDAQLEGERLARVADMHLTRIPTATDVAYAVLYLASRESEVISGVALPVDGGSSAVRARTLG